MIEVCYKLLYLCIYGAYGVVFPYIPLFFDALHMSKAQIGILSMLPNLCSFFVAPIFGVVADKFNAHSELLIVAILVSTVTTYMMLFMTTFMHMFLMVVICSVFRAPIGPQIDSIVISSLEDKSTYGNYRLWGAIGYGCSVFLGGMLTDSGNESQPEKDLSTDENRRNFRAVFAVYNAATLIGGCTILYLVYMQIVKRQENTLLEYIQRSLTSATSSSRSQTPTLIKNSNSRGDISSPSEGYTDGDTVEIELSPIHSDSSQHSSVSTQDRSDEGNGDVITPIVNLFRENPSIYLFCIIVFLSGVGSGCIEAFLFLRLKQLNATGLLMGISRFITCAAEVPMFQIAGYLQVRFGTWTMLAVTQVAFVVRFTYYSLLVNPWAVLPCEMLHGLTYATLWNVSCTYASIIAPPGCSSTVQALLEGLHWGFGAGVGALVGGYLYDYYGAVRLFELSAGMAMISLGLSVFACVSCSNSIGNNISGKSSASSEGQKKKRSSDSSTYSNVPGEDDL